MYKLFAAVTLTASAFAADWKPSGPFGGSIQSVAVDPRHSNILLAGARNGLLFQSMDGAQKWHRVSLGRAISGPVQTLVVDPSNSDHYYVGISGEDKASAGLWESKDAGQHWRQSLPGVAVESLALWPKDPSVVAVGTRHGVYRLRHDAEWTRVSPPQNSDLQDVTALAFDPADARVLYAGTPHLPWKTTDAGVTWHSIRGGMLDDSDVFSIAIDPVQPGRIFASACSGIYRSENAGTAWKLLDGVPRTSRRTHVIAPSPRDPQVLFAGTTSGLLKSEDGGAVWRPLGTLQVNSLAFDPTDSSTLYLATENSGVLVTHDSGATFTVVNQGIHTRNVANLAIAGSSAWLSTAYEGAQGGVFRFEQGQGWRQVVPPSVFGGNVEALAAEPGTNVVYAAAENRLYRFSDTKWELLHTPTLTGIRALAFTGEGALLAGTSRGLFSLTGAVWQPSDVAGHLRLPVQAIYSSGAAVAIRTDFGVYLSRDGGHVWKEWTMPDTVREIAFNCHGMALAATSTGLLRFSPAGSTLLNAIGIPQDTISAVTFDPVNCRTAYAAQFGTTYISLDEGSTWTILAATQTAAIETLRILPSSPRVIFANFRAEGIFTLDLIQP
jgi:photosystem II stability/assembly factor-like uncharacterized protein